MTDIISRIDQATGCQQCGKPLGPSPSDDFCGEGCQHAWHVKRVAARVAGPVQPARYVAGFDVGGPLVWRDLNAPLGPFEVGDRMTIDMRAVGGLETSFVYDGVVWNPASGGQS